MGEYPAGWRKERSTAVGKASGLERSQVRSANDAGSGGLLRPPGLVVRPLSGWLGWCGRLGHSSKRAMDVQRRILPREGPGRAGRWNWTFRHSQRPDILSGGSNPRSEFTGRMVSTQVSSHRKIGIQRGLRYV